MQELCILPACALVELFHVQQLAAHEQLPIWAVKFIIFNVHTAVFEFCLKYQLPVSVIQLCHSHGCYLSLQTHKFLFPVSVWFPHYAGFPCYQVIFFHPSCQQDLSFLSFVMSVCYLPSFVPMHHLSSSFFRHVHLVTKSTY